MKRYNRGMSEAFEIDPVRDVDRRNGNAARARRQAAKVPQTTVDEHGNVVLTAASPLLVPAEKRCTAMTLKGERCKVGRMQGLQVCIFHSHLALGDATLAQIVTEEKPRLSPRRALEAVVQHRADELAQAAVSGALDSDGATRTKAVLALVDAVDPLRTEEATMTLTADGVQSMSMRQLLQVAGHSNVAEAAQALGLAPSPASHSGA